MPVGEGECAGRRRCRRPAAAPRARGGRMTSQSATISPSPRTTSARTIPKAASVLAVTARPGQESADLGGILQVFRRSGASLSLLCLTRGEATPVGTGAARLEAVRPWEVQMAASILGIREVTVANYRDGALHRHRPADLTERIAHAIRQYAPDMLIVVAPEAGARRPRRRAGHVGRRRQGRSAASGPCRTARRTARQARHRGRLDGEPGGERGAHQGHPALRCRRARQPAGTASGGDRAARPARGHRDAALAAVPAAHPCQRGRNYITAG